MAMNNTNIKCPRTDEILSYMYGEIAGASEVKFENHLADCMPCTDEFAAASNARFSVYEWKKEAFDPLPTPDILVPAGEGRDTSWIGGWTGIVIKWADSLSIPLALTACAVLCIGVGILILNSPGNSGGRATANIAGQSVVRQQPVLSPATVESKPAEPPTVIPASVEQREFPPRTRRNYDKHRQDASIEPKRPSQAVKAPVLTAYQDTDDKSLRLAELFDEVGG